MTIIFLTISLLMCNYHHKSYEVYGVMRNGYEYIRFEGRCQNYRLNVDWGLELIRRSVKSYSSVESGIALGNGSDRSKCGHRSR